jgi:hypothetical protein
VHVAGKSCRSLTLTRHTSAIRCEFATNLIPSTLLFSFSVTAGRQRQQGVDGDSNHLLSLKSRQANHARGKQWDSSNLSYNNADEM